jgi:hypothetical protein
LMSCNVAIYCTLVVRNIVMVGCGEPWFTRATVSYRSSPVLGKTEPPINGSSRAPGFGQEPRPALRERFDGLSPREREIVLQVTAGPSLQADCRQYWSRRSGREAASQPSDAKDEGLFASRPKPNGG